MSMSPQYRRGMVDRILRTIDSAEPMEVAAGVGWYEEAHRIASEMADMREVPVANAAAVLAILSQRARWSVNIRWADEVLKAHQEHRHCPAVSWTKARMLAWEACGAASVDNLLRGPKISSFFANIMGDTHAVTVDTWAGWVAMGRDPGSIRGPRYTAIADAYRRAAALRGLTPRDAQAVAWVVIRGGAA